MSKKPLSPVPFLLLLLSLVSLTAGCGAAGEATGSTAALTVSAIPDQDQSLLGRLYGRVSDYLEAKLGVPVSYRPVTSYPAAVTGFANGDLDLVWFGGFTGVQAAEQAPGAVSLAQRNIDREFHSVFVAHPGDGLRPVHGVAGLAELRGHRFTFGSETSTSGRLMPQYFMQRAGVGLGDLAGSAGFSGSHDATIREVEAGSYEAGAVNDQIWDSRLEEGKVDRSKIEPIFSTPGYPDYHWIARGDLDAKLGLGFTAKLKRALLSLSATVPAQRRILELFGAERFVPTHPGDHAEVERAVDALGLGS